MFRIGQEEKDAVARVIDSKELFKINGGNLQETFNFEKELCEKVDSKYSILMTSGHAVLTSALVAMGIGPGDEVIVPAYTYIATAIAVVAAGAVPIIAEINETLMIDPDDIEKKITEKTKAIIPVHMMGYPCDMSKIMAIAKKHNLKVLEDACQADGGSYNGKRFGTIGDAGAYSFNFFKVISAGEGGALLTNNKDIYERALIYHDSSAVAFFGDQMSDFTTLPFCGQEFRSNEITAAILREQLKKLDGILFDLRKNKKIFMNLLAPRFKFIPSNDPDGDCATTLTLIFDTVEEAENFEARSPYFARRPYNTDKHVYTRWAPVLEKRGAFHPLMNPFNFEANKDAKFDKDCCLKSLDILKRTAHLKIDPDWTEEELKNVAKSILDTF